MQSTFAPHAAQVQIYRSLEPPLRGLVVMVIAGRRFGKTVLAINTLIKRAVEIPGSRSWYVAPTKEQAFGIAWRMMLYPHVDKETGEKSLPFLPPELVHKAREDKHFVELKNGSLIEFKGVQDEVFLLGTGLEFVVLDEFPTMPWSVWYDTIHPMLTDCNGDALMIATVPDPKIHNISRDYLDMFEQYLVHPTEVEKSFNFSSYENPHINHQALDKKIKDLEKKGRGADALRLYYGKYTREFGQVFPKWDYDKHTVAPFDIPGDWTRIFTVDPHPQKPIYGLWTAVDPREHHWVYREREFVRPDGSPMTVQEVAYDILKTENATKEKVYRRLIDPTFAKVEMKTIGQKCVKDLFNDYGIRFTEGVRDRMVFFNRLTDMLVEEPETTIHVFRTCPILIRQIPGLTWDSWQSARAREERGVKDQWKKMDDDMVDCLKFALNANVHPISKEHLSSLRSGIENRWNEGRFM